MTDQSDDEDEEAFTLESIDRLMNRSPSQFRELWSHALKAGLLDGPAQPDPAFVEMMKAFSFPDEMAKLENLKNSKDSARHRLARIIERRTFREAMEILRDMRANKDKGRPKSRMTRLRDFVIGAVNELKGAPTTDDWNAIGENAIKANVTSSTDTLNAARNCRITWERHQKSLAEQK